MAETWVSGSILPASLNSPVSSECTPNNNTLLNAVSSLHCVPVPHWRPVHRESWALGLLTPCPTFSLGITQRRIVFSWVQGLQLCSAFMQAILSGKRGETGRRLFCLPEQKTLSVSPQPKKHKKRLVIWYPQMLASRVATLITHP